MPAEPTNQDILTSINEFATNVEENFVELKTDVKELKQRMSKVEVDITQIKNVMVTKSYLDDKLADLRGDLTVLMRKEDTKVKMLVEILRERGVLTEEDKNRVLSMEPFPQLMI
ncbi:MAG: hypothetical protein AAB932_05460 [Patescibacteria group bacterium]